MTYYPLTNETGGNKYDAIIEKDKLIKIINEYCNIDQMNQTEQSFLAQIENEENYVSPKQLLWLRDIKDKYLL